VSGARESFDDAVTERLRAALRERRRPVPEGGRAAEAPDPEAVWDTVSGDLPAGEPLALLDRAIDDPDLELEWRLARELQGELAEAVLRSTVRDRAPRAGSDTIRGRRNLALVAAAVLVAASAATLFLLRSPDEGRVYRQSGAAAVQSLLPPGGELSSADPVLRWSGPEGARYEVSVLREDDLTEVFRAEGLEAAEVELPAAALAALAPAEMLLWRVEAVLAGGQRVVSPTYRVRWSGSE
jgi:hypothetical protein